MFWPRAKMPPMMAMAPRTSAAMRATLTSSSGVALPFLTTVL